MTTTPGGEPIPPDAHDPASRRSFLKYSALAASVPALQSVLANPAAAAAAPGAYAPVPPTAIGPQIPAKGYLVQEIGERLYWLTDGFYQIMFLVTQRHHHKRQRVIVVDAPPTLGGNILRAIEEVAPGARISHLVYSHYHADHIGAADKLRDASLQKLVIIAHEQTAHLLKQVPESTRPPMPNRSVSSRYRLEVDDQVLELHYKGPNHSQDNLFIYAPRQRVLNVVDIVYPGWVPFRNLVVSTNIPGWLNAHNQILEFDFKTYIGGHLTRLGTRQDVKIQQEYLRDLEHYGRKAITEFVDVGPLFAKYPDNPWALFKEYLDILTQTTADAVTPAWTSRLGGADVFTFDNAWTMVESLRLDHKVLGPFGTRA
ncbi:MBL fold metallo-hydrolase [Streptomyces sp. NBC_00287]|uniref:MBL fold metallo-hydrolase n=1 Tax=Streptomyces sp. NBC_00287 TaxID=2975702 RepID=UPI002E2B5A2D|nr:MBL fold metallo-hydrolase [Streptomyces sp. NBC_00287]